MKRKLLSLLLAFMLCLTLLPTAALAGETDGAAWDGTADTSWYDESQSEFHLTTAEQLAGLAQLVNDRAATVSFAGKTLYLDNDLDLSGHQWTSIGFINRFSGTFDGQYHTIANLYHHYTEQTSKRSGLFGVVENGTIRNLFITDADIVSNDSRLNAGILADDVTDSVIENCYTSGRIENNNGHKLLGGLIGQCIAGTQVRGCGSDAVVVSTEAAVLGYFGGDTVGGLIGQWETSNKNSLIADCWFGGSVSCEYDDAGVAGILGAHFGYEDDPNVVIKNCLVATKNITCAEPGNITWITAATNASAASCVWPDSPPSGVELGEDEYPNNNGNYLAVVSLIISGSYAYLDPDFDQSQCGNAASDFTAPAVLAGLQSNAGTGIEWVAGIEHPTFAWDEQHALADYTAVDAALEKANALREGDYKDFSAVKAALASVDRAKSKAEQTEVDAMAQAIEDAVAALEYKDADYTAVDAAIAKANALNESDYVDFSAVKEAVDAVVRGKNITEQDEVDAMAQAIEDAIQALVVVVNDPVYSVTVSGETEGGSVAVRPRYASEGTIVTVTVTTDSSCRLESLTVTDKNGRELTLTDKGNGKYTFAMPAGRVTVSAVFAKEAEVSPFRDVATDAPCYEAVKWAAAQGITGGIGDGLFGPDLLCTRAQIVTFLWRSAGEPEPENGSGFADVSAESYYTKAVAWAVENGVTAGTGNDCFSPDTACTRAQLAAILWRAAGKPEAANAGFADVSPDDWFAAAVNWAAETGVIPGDGGRFAPDGTVTRAQLAEVLMRAVAENGKA